MLRQQVLSLYRRILRTIKDIPDEYYRKEMKEWARDGFRTNKQLKSEIEIKMAITFGNKSLKELQTSMTLAK